MSNLNYSSLDQILVGFRNLLLAFILLVPTSNTYADDIEIYSGVFTAGSAAGTTPAEINPNILFILDTSGSMDSFRLIPAPNINVPGPFDPLVDYGNDGDAFDDDDIYIYSGTSNTTNANLNYTGEFIRPVQNVCQEYGDYIIANPLNPKFFDKIIQWDQLGNGRYNWDRDVVTSSNNLDVVECRADRGSHGISTPASDTFPEKCRFGCTNSAPRYRNNSPQRARNPYRNNRKQYMIPGFYHDYLETLTSANIQSGDASNCVNAGDIIQTNTNPPEYGECQRKIEIMKDALTNAIHSFKDINIALMRFNQNGSSSPASLNGGTVIDAIGDINDGPTKTSFLNKLDGLNASGWTPLAESLMEASRFFKGTTKVYGNSNTDGAATSGSSYITPIINECQDNNIILLSDGLPTRDNNVDGAFGTSCTGAPGGSAYNDSCMDEIAAHMRNTDMVPGNGVPSGVRGENNVYTYTIGFAEDNVHLEDAANAGRPPGAELGSGYFTPVGLQDLEDAFRRIVGNIQSVSADSFVAPAVTVNAFNRLQHREDIYYVVFAPNTSPRWNGNLKKYRVSSDAKIIDANDVDAIEESTGFFKESAQSGWSTVVDGDVVELGGAAENVPTNRDLYGSLDTATSAVTQLNVDGNINSSITQFVNQTVTTNGIDIGEIQSGTSLQITQNRENIAEWTLGVDVDNEHGAGVGEPNFFLGESLHGTPYVLSYGTSVQSPEDMIFFTSNQGLLHAVDGDDGVEKWSYIPDPSLFRNLGEYYNQLATDHVYGLDSEISFLVERNSLDDELEKVNLFFGQRRGGSKVFALDVIDARESNDPVTKLWTIDGGIPGTDFERMGQTWGRPVVTKINYCDPGACGLRDVLIIAGGYDTLYDDELADVASLGGTVQGNAVYIVDAENGDLLWMVSSNVRSSSRDLTISEMTHSIVTSPTVLDVNQDGAADMLFAIDVSGKIFRIDFKATIGDSNEIEYGNNSGKVAGGMIANLSESGVNRRFFNSVDVVLLPPETDDLSILRPARFALITGSGYRAHPLDPEPFGNRIYVVYDSYVTVPLFDEDLDPSLDGDTVNEAVYLYSQNSSASPAVIDMDDTDTRLPNITSGSGDNGYYVALTGVGEKVLSPALISSFRAITISYLPEVPSQGGQGAQSGVCTAGVGNSNANNLNLLTGEVVVTQLVKPGLTATPVVIYVLDVDINGEESLNPVVIIGTEPFKGEEFDLKNLNIGKAEKQTWWEKNRAN